jgi:hypothetical protein
MSLLYIAQQITIYFGSFLLVAGLIGNGINILVFSSVLTYRKTPCTFYFLISSIINIAYLTINLISRIVTEASGIDLTIISISWCKIRNFFLATLVLIALSCSCLATIDHYFATSQSAYVRRFSNIKWAHRIATIMIIFWCLHGILPLVFFTITPVPKTCTYLNAGYKIYALVYFFGLVTSIPISVMVFFAYLTYRNIHLTRVLAEQQADRQLTRMVLIQILLVVIGFLPYAANTAYNYITSQFIKDTNQQIEELFVLTIFSLLPYLYYAVCLFFLLR